MPLTCVSGYGAATRARYANAYLQHPVRFAYAGGSNSAAARAFYVPRYFSLGTAFWSGTKYGNTGGLSKTQMEGLVSLQVYSLRRYAQYNRYPAGRIGLAWDNAPTNSDFADLATRAAVAIQAAYGPGGPPPPRVPSQGRWPTTGAPGPSPGQSSTAAGSRSTTGEPAIAAGYAASAMRAAKRSSAPSA